jgi:hypothetical protein
MTSFTPNFTITNRQTSAITRIELARSAWHDFGFGNSATTSLH